MHPDTTSTPDDGPRVYRIDDVCYRLSRGRSFVYGEIKRGTLATVRIGSRQGVTIDELRRYINACRSNDRAAA